MDALQENGLSDIRYCYHSNSVYQKHTLYKEIVHTIAVMAISINMAALNSH